MPRLLNRNPSYRHHRASGQAIVTIDGRDLYLGPHGTKASRNEYDRVIGEWLANGRRSTAAVADLTVSELVARFWDHAKVYYRHADGSATSEQSGYKLALGVLVRLYGPTLAADFGPLALESVRNEMIAKGWARGSINTHHGRLKRVFRWGVAKELVPAGIFQALVTVPGLRAGRSAARETDPVRPVPAATIEQTLPALSPTVAAMVRLQLLTGARPGEIVTLRTGDIDRSDSSVWTITPRHHKAIHHGHTRTIHVGPQAQAVLLPFLRLDAPEAFIFSPAAADRVRRERQHAARLTPLHYGNRPGTNRRRRPKKTPGDRYDVSSYRRAIANACDVAFPLPAHLAKCECETRRAWRERITLSPAAKQELAAWRRKHRWHPHQLRHSAATMIRKQFGIEAAQHVLGHATLSVTELYAEKNSQAARQVAAAIG